MGEAGTACTTNPSVDTQQVGKFHVSLPFDGLWVDMNEPSNLLGPFNCSHNKYNNPPYKWVGLKYGSRDQ